MCQWNDKIAASAQHHASSFLRGKKDETQDATITKNKQGERLNDALSSPQAPEKNAPNCQKLSLKVKLS
jgi:hypothetical protein